MEDMNIVIVGHVDHGKSTIIGRLLSDTHSLHKGKLEQVKEKCRRNSRPFEYAFLLDALKDEQAQGITIDAARCFFKTEKRRYIIIDAPGHIEFLKNMVTGASRAEAALLVIDAKEGIKENSKRHGYMLSMLGISQVSVIVNKMDLVDYSEDRYKDIVTEYGEFLRKININVSSFIPVSGTEGDNIAFLSEKMRWHKGNTVLQELDIFKASKIPRDKPFRMFVQDVYKFTKNNDNRRIVAGTIDSGKIQVGDDIVFYPSMKKSVVKSIETFNREPIKEMNAGYAVGFTLDEQIYVKRGELAVLNNQPKPNISSRIKTDLFWLGKDSMIKDKDYILKIGTTKVKAKLEDVIKVMDSSNLNSMEKDRVDRYEVAECTIKLEKQIAFDICSDITETSRFVIVDDYEICGGGIINKALDDYEHKKSSNTFYVEGKVTYEDRCKRLNQKGIVVWFTGLSASGKSTIAIELEKELFKEGRYVYRLDGDNIRYGLNSDLEFSREDRNENLRRIAEVANLFKDSGCITLTAFISPYKNMREFAKDKIGEESFIEVYLKASLEVCKKRDPKGLYEKALKGEIEDFTGISSIYEEPENADLVLETDKLSVDECTKLILEEIYKRINSI